MDPSPCQSYTTSFTPLSCNWEQNFSKSSVQPTRIGRINRLFERFLRHNNTGVHKQKHMVVATQSMVEAKGAITLAAFSSSKSSNSHKRKHRKVAIQNKVKVKGAITLAFFQFKVLESMNVVKQPFFVPTYYI